jgi:FAD/FMN-containing dehydrogenase
VTAAATSLEQRLRREVRGEVAFDALTRGLYATDASIYQVEPLGVITPRDVDDVIATRAICAEAGVSLLPRGAGTSQCGQTVNAAVVVDVSKHLCNVEAVDVASRRVRVQPGVVLDRLNARLAREGLFFPVDPSTASRATIGGMTANAAAQRRSDRCDPRGWNAGTLRRGAGRLARSGAAALPRDRRARAPHRGA